MNFNISQNIRKLIYVFVVIFALLSGGLVYWQVIVASQVTANEHNSRQCLPDSAPFRGRIFDRNGVLLAESKLVSTAPCAYQRFYYLKNYPSLAGLIGYYISPAFSSSGIEHYYDKYLMGQVGLTELNNTMNGLLHRAPVGDDIYLTIDTRIQKIAENAFVNDTPLPDNVNVFPPNPARCGYRGSLIVTDPRTGEILAMVSRPTFDPNRIATGDLTYFTQVSSDPCQPLIERPLDFAYPPGSTYKTMTLLAALDSGSAHLNDPFDKQHALGPVTVGSGSDVETFYPSESNIQGYTFHYPVDLNYGFTHSDNVIFAQVGVKTGAKTWLDYNQRFLVGKPNALENLPVTTSTVTKGGKPLSVAQLAENSFGQGIDLMTPFQMSLIDNAVANNGVLMRPTIIEKIVDPNGSVIQSASPQALATPMSEQTASQVRDAMYGVVQCGSGKFTDAGAPISVAPTLDQSPYAIIAKTGTAQAPGGPADSWLITQAPYLDGAHRLTIVAMKENAGEGGSVVGPVVRTIYDQLFSSSFMKIATQAPPSANYCFNTGLLQ